jgi:transaldolase
MNIIKQLYDAGQSVWCDNLSRAMLDSGELQRLIELGIVGITSNPTIFMKAITGSNDYDDRIQNLLDEGMSDTHELYERLVVPDIADAADILRPAYDRTGGVDGFVSLEVSPLLAYDTQGTIEEARRLHAELDRPNILIKVPATANGIPAIETLIGEGVSVNVTLIFAVSVYEQVMDAYLNGLRKLAKRSGDLSKVASVASFFVSRVDSAVDKILEQKQSTHTQAASLLGKTAIANADQAYSRFREKFGTNGPFGELQRRGARVQRPLWASTSTKNLAYPDTIYVDNLVAANTVNTMPPQTIEATLDHGRVGSPLGTHVEQSRRILAELTRVGVDLDKVSGDLSRDGVKLFVDSFESLLKALSSKQSIVRAR